MHCCVDPAVGRGVISYLVPHSNVVRRHYKPSVTGQVTIASIAIRTSRAGKASARRRLARVWYALSGPYSRACPRASGLSEKHSLFTSAIERQSFMSREAINSNIVPPGRSESGPAIKNFSASSRSFGLRRGQSQTLRMGTTPSQSREIRMPVCWQLTSTCSPLSNTMCAKALGLCAVSLFTRPAST